MSAETTVELVRRRFSVAEYERMGEAGILGEDDRVELLNGEIVQMTPIGPLHAAVVGRLTRLLIQRLGDRAVVRVQNPLLVGSSSQPQPDIAVVRARNDSYRTSHPAPADVLLAVEVADSSLDMDRGVKIPMYATAGIPEAWLVDLAAVQVVVHRDPGEGAFASVRSRRLGESLDLAATADVTLTVDELLGP